MPTEVTTLIFNLISQAPLVALVAYLWFMDRRDKHKQIEFLRNENVEKGKIIDDFTESLNKLSLSLELIKDRLR